MFRTSIKLILALAFLTTIALTFKSVVDFTHTGPKIAEEIMRSYFWYSIYALGRLAVWVFILAALCGLAGVLVYHALVYTFRWKYRWLVAFLAAGAAFGLITLSQFLHHLLHVPGGLIASFNYRTSRLYPIWEQLTPDRIAFIDGALIGVFYLAVTLALVFAIRRKDYTTIFRFLLITVPLSSAVVWARWDKEAPPVAPGQSQESNRPNIVMIGSDTLRADRLSVNGYNRSLTPNIDRLAKQGANFSEYIVPIARTGPSLVSMLTSTWPHTHTMRDNFVGDEARTLPFAALPQLLNQAGYQTAVISDWAGSDLGKFSLGFTHVDTSPDQWNLKYLLRQGPKDIRLFLSLFTHNRFGKTFIPEVYYLAGMPLTPEVGRESRRVIKQLAEHGKPFLVDIFMATTHGPFSSSHPYYQLFREPTYRGESLFAMGDLSSVEDVVRAQETGKQHFDVQQVINLYDGAVKEFDDEVGRLVRYLKDSGLDKNTIVVVYSDHGVDLFEGETWGQGNVVSDYSHRAPLVIFDPRRASIGDIHRTVRTVDIAPTLLQLTGLTVPGQMEGKSLLPFLEHGNAEPDRVVFAETGIWIGKVKGLPENRIEYPSIFELLEIPDKQSGTLAIKPKYRDIIVRAKSLLAREGRWALVYFPLTEGAQYSLYDIAKDRGMSHDVANLHPDITERLKAKLTAWRKGDRQ